MGSAQWRNIIIKLVMDKSASWLLLLYYYWVEQWIPNCIMSPPLLTISKHHATLFFKIAMEPKSHFIKIPAVLLYKSHGTQTPFCKTSGGLPLNIHGTPDPYFIIATSSFVRSFVWGDCNPTSFNCFWGICLLYFWTFLVFSSFRFSDSGCSVCGCLMTLISLVFQ